MNLLKSLKRIVRAFMFGGVMAFCAHWSFHMVAVTVIAALLGAIVFYEDLNEKE